MSIDSQAATFDDVDQADAVALVDGLAAMAREQQGQPEPIAAGTFVLYPMADGGLMFVTSVDHGPLAGIKHSRIAPGLIRAVSVLAGGGSKLSALKAMAGFGKREISAG